MPKVQGENRVRSSSSLTACIALAASFLLLSTMSIAKSQEPDSSAGQWIRRGDKLLRGGDWSMAVEAFDRAIEIRPDQMPYLWQRGIALYFKGDYRQAADQFAKHRAVNPNDVENAAWHFLCIAKADSPKKAKATLLPAPGDRREPMDEVLSMLMSGDTAIVINRIEQLTKESPDSATHKEAAFYGNFYLGLYADAIGDAAKAKARMKSAAQDAPGHYMGDIAGVYAKFLEAEGSKPKESN